MTRGTVASRAAYSVPLPATNTPPAEGRKVSGTYHVGYPDIDRKGTTQSSLLAVCVEDGSRYAVYVGICTLPDPSHRLYDKARKIKAEKIAQMGTKLNFQQSRTYFRNIPEDHYSA